MKPLRNIRYIIFALTVLGCFANFAQNEYGMSMIIWGTFLIGLCWMVGLALLGKEMWKKKFISIMLTSTFSLFVISIVLLNFWPDALFGFSMLTFVFSTLTLIAVLALELLLVAIANRKQHPSGSSLAFESFGLFILFIGITFKFGHWPGASIMMILGGSALVVIYFIEILKSFSEFRNRKMTAVFSFLFYFNVILGVAGSVVKNQHWPGSIYFYQSEILLLIILLVPILLNLKFKLGMEKTSLAVHGTKRAVFVFVFVFLNYWALFFSLPAWGVGPKFYSLKNPPALEKMLETSVNGDEPQIREYRKNYENFLENRYNAENK